MALAAPAASAFAAQALPAASGSPSPYRTPAGPAHAQQFRKAQALRDLREEGLKIQAADGGTLRPEHRAELRQKLDHILAGNY